LGIIGYSVFHTIGTVETFLMSEKGCQSAELDLMHQFSIDKLAPGPIKKIFTNVRFATFLQCVFCLMLLTNRFVIQNYIPNCKNTATGYYTHFKVNLLKINKRLIMIFSEFAKFLVKLVKYTANNPNQMP